MLLKVLTVAGALMLTTGLAFAQDDQNQTQDNQGSATPGTNPQAGESAGSGEGANFDTNNDGKVTIGELRGRAGSEAEANQAFASMSDEQLQQLRTECQNDTGLEDPDRETCERLSRFQR